MKLSGRPVVTSAVLAAVFAGLSPLSALATGRVPPVGPQPASVTAEDEPTTGGDVHDGSFVPDEQAMRKGSIVQQWNDLIDRTGTSDREQLKVDVEAFAAKYGMAALTGGDTGAGKVEMTAEQFVATTDVVGKTASTVLNVAHSGQIKGFYCGPATAFMIMRYKGITSSRYASDRGRALSQGALARSTYLRTDEHGATRFALNVMGPGMNRWRENRTAGYYVQFPAARLPTTLNGIMRFATAMQMPPAIGTVEIANGPRYNNHGSPSKTIGHWILGHGYAGGGTMGYYTDPATTVWNGVAPKFAYTTAGFERYFIKAHGNGVVY